MKTSLGTIVVTIAISLLFWVFFYFTTGPLTAPETTVIVGFAR